MFAPEAQQSVLSSSVSCVAPHNVEVLIGHVSGSVDVQNDSVPHVACQKKEPDFNKNGGEDAFF